MHADQLAGERAAANRQADGQALGRPNLVAYSLVSGVAATAAGAVLSLTVVGVARIAVWCTVTGAMSVASGLARDSAAVSSRWAGFRQWLVESSAASGRSRWF